MAVLLRITASPGGAHHPRRYERNGDADACTARVDNEIAHPGVTAGDEMLRHLDDARERSQSNSLAAMAGVISEPEGQAGCKENCNMFKAMTSTGHRPP